MITENILNNCIKLIENKENKKLIEYLKDIKCFYYNNGKIIFNAQNNLYDVAIKNNNFRAFNILLNHDCKYYNWESFSKNSDIFNPKQLKCLLRKGFIISTNFINLIITKKGNDGVALLNFLYKISCFNNSLVLQFLLNFYKNKIPLSSSRLNEIVEKEKRKISFFDTNSKSDFKITDIYKNDQAVKKLLDCGTNTLSPLETACKKENKLIIKNLVEYGANVNTEYQLIDNCVEDLEIYKKVHIKTPLFLACEKRDESMVKYLIEKGADPNLEYHLYKFKKGYFDFFFNSHQCKTPLHMACEYGDEFIVRYLVEHGANVNYNKDNIISPLGMACKKGNEFIEKYLIEHGANVNTEYQLIDNDDWGDWRYRYKGIKVQVKTPLFLACEKRDESMVKYLIEKGADPNLEYHLYKFEKDYRRFFFISHQCKTPLHMACEYGDEFLVRYLVEHGANVNGYPSDSISPLGIVCENGDEFLVRYLVEHGANVNGYPSNNISPLGIACEKNYKFLVNYLVNIGAHVDGLDGNTISPLGAACKEGNYILMKYLIEQGANINGLDSNIMTPLGMACEQENQSIVQYLIDHGANVNIECKFIDYKKYGYKIDKRIQFKSPLFIACESGKDSLVKILIENGAYVNAEYKSYEFSKDNLDKYYECKKYEMKTPLCIAYEKKSEYEKRYDYDNRYDLIINYLKQHDAYIAYKKEDDPKLKILCERKKRTRTYYSFEDNKLIKKDIVEYDVDIALKHENNNNSNNNKETKKFSKSDKKENSNQKKPSKKSKRTPKPKKTKKSKK